MLFVQHIIGDKQKKFKTYFYLSLFPRRRGPLRADNRHRSPGEVGVPYGGEGPRLHRLAQGRAIPPWARKGGGGQAGATGVQPAEGGLRNVPVLRQEGREGGSGGIGAKAGR